MRLLIECTYVYEHPKDNSGIQRVVRNIVTQLGKTRKIARTVPVILKNNHIYEVKKLSPNGFNMYISNLLYSWFVSARERSWLFYLRIEELWLFRAWDSMRRLMYMLCKPLGIFFQVPILIISHYCLRSEIDDRIVELKVQPGDVLVLLDSSWHSDCFSQVEKLKSQGVIIVSVIYDLIPLTHSQFCDEGLVVVFQRWFKWVSQTADGFMTISKTIRDQAQAYVRQGIADTKQQDRQWFDYFHLGSELDLAKKNDIIRQQVKEVFQNGSSVYLMVGTIEPRKNHGYLLDAFELLWQKDSNVKLCFVGKVGWKCQALIERVETHGEHNRRLFMFNDLNDTELEYCYRKSRSLVFPSYVEGFGLPLIEAMQRGLSAMASDIPVFREVGGDFIAYFDLKKPETLAALVQNYEASGEFPASKKLKVWSWLNWEDSAKQLLTRITFHVAAQRVETNSTVAEVNAIQKNSLKKMQQS